MLDYMDYVQKCFESGGKWERSKSYGEVTRTSLNLVDFRIPDGVSLQVSNKATPYSYNSLQISTRNSVNGALSYLYTDLEAIKDIVKDTKNVSLQEVSQTYERPTGPGNNIARPKPQDPGYRKFQKSSLYYGKIYYPSSDIEALLMKRVSPTTQLVLKCFSSLKENTNIFTGYLQRDSGRNFQELILSSNDLLCGYRVAHNFLTTPSKLNSSLYNNSSLSLGAEVWLGLISLNPGCSTTVKYCTHSANTGRPLTLTLSWNPLFGHISSTYSAKTSACSTFCAKYDFNIYSIESNLTFGCEFWRRNTVPKKESPVLTAPNTAEYEKHFYISHDHNLLPPQYLSALKDTNIREPSKGKRNHEQLLNDLTHTFSTSLRKIDKEKSRIERFETSMRDSHFTNVFKMATSLRDKNLKLLWEGEYRNFLISAGTELLFPRNPSFMADTKQSQPAGSNMLSALSIQPLKFGIQFQFSS
ncbi:Mitochondrial distribution and morphology protein 10 [Nakaseomyces bracarensis]|uniref:Mitochondrial distribution and morphology protein 10 n=1 Tax=Nakaseomyces bracarensis TaxID=273131 RepID=A0ABR4NSK3_9SACH